MNAKFFLDTNIIVYSFDTQAPEKTSGLEDSLNRPYELMDGW